MTNEEIVELCEDVCGIHRNSYCPSCEKIEKFRRSAYLDGLKRAEELCVLYEHEEYTGPLAEIRREIAEHSKPATEPAPPSTSMHQPRCGRLVREVSSCPLSSTHEGPCVPSEPEVSRGLAGLGREGRDDRRGTQPVRAHAPSRRGAETARKSETAIFSDRRRQ